MWVSRQPIRKIHRISGKPPEVSPPATVSAPKQEDEITLLRKAALGGGSSCQAKLGYKYPRGEGVEQDSDESFHLAGSNRVCAVALL